MLALNRCVPFTRFVCSFPRSRSLCLRTFILLSCSFAYSHSPNWQFEKWLTPHCFEYASGRAFFFLFFWLENVLVWSNKRAEKNVWKTKASAKKYILLCVHKHVFARFIHIHCAGKNETRARFWTCMCIDKKNNQNKTLKTEREESEGEKEIDRIRILAFRVNFFRSTIGILILSEKFSFEFQ